MRSIIRSHLLASLVALLLAGRAWADQREPPCAGTRSWKANESPVFCDPDDDWAKDPSVIKAGDTYYMYYTSANPWQGDGCGGKGEPRIDYATSSDGLNWTYKGLSDPKVFRDGDHWTMLYFGVGRGGAHVMVAFSRDLLRWTADPEPLYKAGGHPDGLDKQFAHKVSLVFNPKNETFYLYYCSCGNKGRCIGLITSKPLPK